MEVTGFMRVATDIGGTFTDLVAIGDDGSLVQEKAHTTPPNFEEGVMDVLEKSGVKPEGITAFFHGTTTIINALTERKGAKTALLTTQGFRDERKFSGVDELKAQILRDAETTREYFAKA